jgi:hypothetical protein
MNGPGLCQKMTSSKTFNGITCALLFPLVFSGLAANTILSEGMKDAGELDLCNCAGRRSC